MTKPLRNLKTRLADGLTSWLTFEFACERGYLFSEQYLAHAVGQLLRAGGSRVLAEVPHPLLAIPGGVGRPPSIDFVVYGQEKQPVVAVETKWAGYSDVTAGALAWDAFRLEAFSRKAGVPGLLVFGGTRLRLDTLFGSTAFRRRTGTAGLFPLPAGSAKRVLSREDLSEVAARYVSSKATGCPDGAIGNELFCELPQIAQHVGPRSISFAVYVWEIGTP